MARRIRRKSRRNTARRRNTTRRRNTARRRTRRRTRRSQQMIGGSTQETPPTAGGFSSPIRVSIDKGVVYLVEEIKKLYVQEYPTIKEFPVSTSHSYILLSYMYHKLREKSTGSTSHKVLPVLYGNYRKSVLESMKYSLELAGNRAREKKGTDVTYEAVKSLASMIQTGLGLTVASASAGLAGAAGSMAIGTFIVATGGVAVVPIIFSMATAIASNRRTQWEGDVMSNYHLNTSIKNDFVTHIKQFVYETPRSLLRDLEIQYKTLQHMEILGGSTKIELPSLCKIFVDAFKKMVGNSEILETDRPSSEEFMIAFTFISYQTSYYFKSRSSEVVGEVEVLKQRIDILEEKLNSLRPQPSPVFSIASSKTQTPSQLDQELDAITGDTGSALTQTFTNAPAELSESSKTLKAPLKAPLKEPLKTPPELPPSLPNALGPVFASV